MESPRRLPFLAIRAACAAIIAVAAFSGPALPAEGGRGQNSGGETRAYLGAGKAEIALAPEGIDIAYLREEMARLDPDVCVESLSAVDLPPAIAALPRPEREAAIGNVLRSISALKGIEYYSASRGKRRVLFEEAFVLASPDADMPMPDPFRSAPPEREEFSAILKDSTFGKNTMRLEYRAANGTHSLSVTNLTAMKIGPVAAVKPGRFEIILSAREESGRILVYAFALARASALPGLRDKIRESTENRVYALLEWIKSGLSAPPSGPR